MPANTHPILSIDQARDLEGRLFAGDETREWPAMQAAGRSLALAILTDYSEIGTFPQAARLLVLAGKGHNAGDALIACSVILDKFPGASAQVVFVYGERSLRPLARRAWVELLERYPGRVGTLSPRTLPVPGDYTLSIDGIYGFRYRPPLDAAAHVVLTWEAAQTVDLRAAVDLPSGLDAVGAFQADFTYATGIVKRVLLTLPNAGRLRYLDLGFFPDWQHGVVSAATERVLTTSILAPLRKLRSAQSDKRSYGHVFILGGSRQFPGAVLMSVLGALRSGAGLVTAFVPESLVPVFAARAPEAMWVGWPETPDGGLALEGFYLLQHRLGRASALVLGPGLGREAETLAVIEGLVKSSEVPLVLDADALQPGIASKGKAPRILTPHAGEYLRLAGGGSPEKFARETGATLVLKGSVTRVATEGKLYHSFFGGPLLARGGSGDVLAGLIGGLLAQTPLDLTGAALRGVVWHGLAADLLAREHGQVAPRTTELIDYLGKALRQESL